MMEMKFGRLPPKNAPAIAFRNIFKAVPEHPLQFTYIFDNLDSWQVLGNDKYGDCVAVTWANTVRTISNFLGNGEYYPTLEETLQVYKTQNPKFPQDDNGMVIQTLLEHLHHNGGPDGRKPVAFAKVNPKNLEEIKAALAIFGTAWFGITVKQANMDDTAYRRPWTEHPTSPIVGYHAVMGGSYYGIPSGDLGFVTWGLETSMSHSYVSMGLLDEVWVIVWPENLGTKQFQEGIDAQKLKQVYFDLTGRNMDIPFVPVNSPGCGVGALKGLYNFVTGKK